MTMTVIDLIYVQYTDGRTMAVAVVDGDNDEMLGPVPAKAAVTGLAVLLRAKLPEKFPTDKDAENFLALIHARNMLAGKNCVGQDYPYAVDAPMGSTP